MSAVTAIVLADAQATPVNHTFIPLGPDTKGVWWFEDQSVAVPDGFNRISIQLTRAEAAAAGQTTSGMNRVKITLHVPTLEVLSTNEAGYQPAPRVAYIVRASAEFILPGRSSEQNRKDTRKYMQFLLANAQVVDAVEKLINIY